MYVQRSVLGDHSENVGVCMWHVCSTAHNTLCITVLRVHTLVSLYTEHTHHTTPLYSCVLYVHASRYVIAHYAHATFTSRSEKLSEPNDGVRATARSYERSESAADQEEGDGRRRASARPGRHARPPRTPPSPSPRGRARPPRTLAGATRWRTSPPSRGRAAGRATPCRVEAGCLRSTPRAGRPRAS